MREYIDGYTVAAQIQLESMDHRGTFVVVEGRADILLFGKFIDENCRLMDATRRSVAIEAVGLLRQRGVCRACCIVDDDYSRKLDTTPADESVFLKDFNDIEMMIVASEAFDDFVREKCDPEKIKSLSIGGPGEVREYIAERAAIFGFLSYFKSSKRIGNQL